MAAQRKVCSPFGFLAARMTRIFAVALLFSIASPGARPQDPQSDSTSKSRSYLFSASVDLITGK
jgi:hypothetical protein